MKSADRMGRQVCCLVLAACGRMGFDPIGDVSVDAAGATAPAMVQTSSGHSANGQAITATLAPTGADRVVVIAAVVYDGASSITSIDDDAGTTYVTASARATAGGDATEIWYAPQPHAAATRVTVHLSDAVGGATWVAELAGVDPAMPTPAITSNEMSDTTIVAPAMITTLPDELVFSVAADSLGDITGLHAGNDFTALPVIAGDAAAYRIAIAPGSYAAEWDGSTNLVGAACASSVAFHAAAN
jgi:hypothetical protein